jgi:hypothetical protein
MEVRLHMLQQTPNCLIFLYLIYLRASARRHRYCQAYAGHWPVHRNIHSLVGSPAVGISGSYLQNAGGVTKVCSVCPA